MALEHFYVLFCSLFTFFFFFCGGQNLRQGDYAFAISK